MVFTFIPDRSRKFLLSLYSFRNINHCYIPKVCKGQSYFELPLFLMSELIYLVKNANPATDALTCKISMKSDHTNSFFFGFYKEKPDMRTSPNRSNMILLELHQRHANYVYANHCVSQACLSS